MNKQELCNIIRNRANNMLDGAVPATADDAELLFVLARIVEGKPVERAFGAPGDWGYSNPIGKAIAQQ